MKDNYVSMAKYDNCKICNGYKDLRFGTCFTCSSKISGEQISAVTHKLWQTDKPSNYWFCSTDNN